MLRKLLLFLSAATVMQAHAQSAATPTKATEKQGDTQIDYKLTGAPLPPVRILIYKDTSASKAVPAAMQHEEETPRRKKRHHETTAESNARPKLQGMVTNKELENGANLFLMIFNPTCSHCEDETAMLEKNISLFDKSHLVLLATPIMTPYVSDFYKLMHIKDYPQITVGIDSANYLDKVFLYKALPQINIYDNKQRLLKIFSGEVSIDSLKQYIE